MISVAVGWQIYALTGRPLYLGYVGLVQFLAILLFIFIGGSIADRFDRRNVVIAGLVGIGLCAGLLFSLSRSHAGVATTFGVLFLFGALRAVIGPSAQAYVPHLVPEASLASAVTWTTSLFQVASVVGPALGGLVYAQTGGADAVYALGAISFLASAFTVATIPVHALPQPVSGARGDRNSATPPSAFNDLTAGIRYVANHRLLLSLLSLDLFAVLAGGAVALLPVFARDVLNAGPTELGILRASPAAGAALMALVLARFPLGRHIGRLLIGSVLVFGLATIGFGLSTSYPLSLFFLVVVGASDMISVIVRHTTVQLATPPEKRGRVSAVNGLFITTSNELGELESGITAEWWGPRKAAVVGGSLAVAVVLIWDRLYPELRKLDRLEDARYRV